MTTRRGQHGAAARLSLVVPLVLAGLAAVVAGQGRVLLHDCVSAGGALGPLGLRLAVLRDAADCPEGAYGLGPMSQGAVVLLSVAVPVAALYLVLTACGIGLGALLVRAARQVRLLVGRALRGALRPARPLPVDTRVRLVPRAFVASWTERVLLGSIARRGPPTPA
ncbi:hypothetical protein [Cellulomonas fengjieae]|uniref:Uncharacterized protein n=1 Tax=Cellulomonas fengjieae TaxID=2819978 RepID=A0ABS3SGY8_9CELL|nr:hypothetical protein [Cellulomonas fengjieae]MBO3084997.1 hypothetical protein [Cellulomonas fengjieae]QVI66405.1 hypothetical protein KG102_02005 [Cellulomonas fengjieae]